MRQQRILFLKDVIIYINNMNLIKSKIQIIKILSRIFLYFEKPNSPTPLKLYLQFTKKSVN